MKRALPLALVWFIAAQGLAQLETGKGAVVSGTVVDDETGKPLLNFRIMPGAVFVFPDGPLRWDRDNVYAGFDGKFTFRLSEQEVRAGFGVAIEAAGYLPSASPRYTNAGTFTHEFRMKKGQGISGILSPPRGEPVAGATVYLVDSTQRVYMNEAGQIDEPASRNASVATTDGAGRFTFEPRLDPNAVVVAHPSGYAEVWAEQVIESGKVILQPWSAVKGVVKLGSKIAANLYVGLDTMEYQYGDGPRFLPPLDLRLTTRPDESGAFAFPKVPPGERRVYVQHGEAKGPAPVLRSHAFAVDVRPGETTEVGVGGNGYRVSGKVTAKIPIDWTQESHVAKDAHLLILKHPDEPASRSFKAQKTFWISEAGRAHQRSPHQYLLVFKADGSFHADGVPSGQYTLTIRPTDRDPDSLMLGKLLGELRTNVVVRDKPLELGTLELRVR